MFNQRSEQAITMVERAATPVTLVSTMVNYNPLAKLQVPTIPVTRGKHPNGRLVPQLGAL